MFEFYPCDRCRYSDNNNKFCKKHFNQFKTNERYLTAVSKSKVVDILSLCYKFRYINEPTMTFKELFQKRFVQLPLF